jgi:serine/threonine-protein kinase
MIEAAEGLGYAHQLKGPDGQPLDGRADQFAPVVVLYQLLTGKPMFDQDTELAFLHAILEGKRPAVREVRPDVPKALDQVVARATEVRPDESFPSVKVFRDALHACLGAEVTREALGARLRELFAVEFESHAQLMGKLSTAGTDELRRLYAGARHSEAEGAGGPTELVAMPHATPPRPARTYALIACVALLALAGAVGLGARTKRPPEAPTGSITVRSDHAGAADPWSARWR